MTLEERIQIYERAFSSDGGDAVLGRAHIAYIIEAIRLSPALRFGGCY